VNSISECILNVLNGNLKLTDCSKRKLRKHKTVLRKVADKRVSTNAKKRLINQRRGFFAFAKCSTPDAWQSIIQIACQVKMLRKMYLVSADKFTQPPTSVEIKNSFEPPLRKKKRVLKNNK